MLIIPFFVLAVSFLAQLTVLAVPIPSNGVTSLNVRAPSWVDTVGQILVSRGNEGDRVRKTPAGPRPIPSDPAAQRPLDPQPVRPLPVPPSPPARVVSKHGLPVVPAPVGPRPPKKSAFT